MRQSDPVGTAYSQLVCFPINLQQREVCAYKAQICIGECRISVVCEITALFII